VENQATTLRASDWSPANGNVLQLGFLSGRSGPIVLLESVAAEKSSAQYARLYGRPRIGVLWRCRQRPNPLATDMIPGGEIRSVQFSGDTAYRRCGQVT
jgi:hypothetical protein